MGQLNVNSGPWNVIMGPWNVHTDRGMLLWDSVM